MLYAAEADPAYKARLAEMARNVLWAIYDNKLDENLPEIAPVDSEANSEVALAVAREGIVLLRNENGILLLGADIKSIALIGGHADTGTMVGGGSSRAFGDDGPAATLSQLGGPNAPYLPEQDVGNGLASTCARVPCLNNAGDLFPPRHGDRPASLQDYDGVRVCRGNRAD